MDGWSEVSLNEAREAFERGDEVEVRVVDPDAKDGKRGIGHGYATVTKLEGNIVNVDRGGGFIDEWEARDTGYYTKHYRVRKAPKPVSMELRYSEAEAAFERGENVEVFTKGPWFDGWQPVRGFGVDETGDSFYEIHNDYWFCDDNDKKTTFRVAADPPAQRGSAFTCHLEYEDGGWKHSMSRSMDVRGEGDLHRVTLPPGIIIHSVELFGSRLNMQAELAK